MQDGLERHDDGDIEVVGPAVPVTEEVAEEVETTEEPVEEAAPVEEEEVPPAEEAAPVEEEVTEPEVDAPPEVSREDLELELAEVDKTIAERKEKADYWTKQAREARDLRFQPWKAEIQEEPAVAAEESPVGPEPQQEDFEDYDSYYRAVARYETDLRIHQHDQNRMNQSMIQELELFKEDVVEAGTSKYGDFEEVGRDPSLAITTQMLHMMRELEYPEDVVYYLGRHPQEAIKIARQTPAGMAVSLVKLETRIQTELKDNPPAKPDTPQPTPRTTTAPPPVKPVSGGSEQVEQDPEKMTPAQYREWRERGGGGGEY